MAIDFPNSPTVGDTYTTNGKTYRWDGTVWGVYGTFTVDSTASDTEPTGVGNGHIWYRSDQSQTLIRYNDTWVEVGSAGGFDSSSTSFPTSLDSGTGFAAVEALQAKVGVDSSAVTTSLDYKIAQLEALGTAVAFTPSWTDFTPGNATETWYYTQVNDLVHVFGDTVLGSTSSVTGIVYLDYPVGTVSAAGALAGVPIGRVRFTDASAGSLIMGVVQISGTTRASLQLELATGTYVERAGGINTNTPFTWTTSDRISASFIYQIT